MTDEYGFEKRFKTYTVDQLIECFNGEVGNPGWVRARGVFLEALRKALLATGLDCSDFIEPTEMSLRYPIKLEKNRIVQVHT